MAFLSKCPIAGKFPTCDRLFNKLKLFSGNKWTVERNVQGFSPLYGEPCQNRARWMKTEAIVTLTRPKPDETRNRHCGYLFSWCVTASGADLAPGSDNDSGNDQQHANDFRRRDRLEEETRAE